MHIFLRNFLSRTLSYFDLRVAGVVAQIELDDASTTVLIVSQVRLQPLPAAANHVRCTKQTEIYPTTRCAQEYVASSTVENTHVGIYNLTVVYG